MKLSSKNIANYTTSLLTKESKQYSFSQFCSISAINSNASYMLQCYFFTAKNIGILASTPTYNHTNIKVNVEIFYYISSRSKQDDSLMTSITDISVLSKTLASIYKKEVSLVFTRIHYPYLNSSIFAQYLAHNAVSNTFAHFQDSILTYPSRNLTKLPTYIAGIKIELSGRLTTEAAVPRKTKKAFLLGSFSGASMVDYAKYTTKNDLGAFTIKV